MGLFQYNRFGQEDNTAEKDNNSSRRSERKTKEFNIARNARRTSHYKSLASPAYAELYQQYQVTMPNAATSSSTTSPTTTTTITSAVAAKTVELAIKKWSSKLLTTTAVATDEISAATSAGYQQQLPLTSSDTALLVVATSRKAKVYDCMKDFLRRKLFQQTQDTQQQVAANKDEGDEEEDATSDYDEIDVLDSSYNADEEYDTDTSSSCALPLDNAYERRELAAASTRRNAESLPATSFNCWTQTSSTSSSECGSSEDHTDEDIAENEDNSDAGISDCCQLLGEKSPKRRSATKKSNKKTTTTKTRYNMNDDEELLDDVAATWYQPRLSRKAAAARLQCATSGDFVLSRVSRRSSYVLSLRLETKVKTFSVIANGEYYKFKGAKKEFSTLKALVTHHSVMAEQLPLTLTLPRVLPPKSALMQRKLMAPSSSSRYADDFDSYESLQLLGILQSLQSQNVEYA